MRPVRLLLFSQQKDTLVPHNTIEIEIDHARNANVVFYPAGRLVRGRFLHSRVDEPSAVMHAGRWAEHGIIGQVIGVDLDAREGFIREPLRDAKHATLADRIKQRGMSLAPAREAFPLATDDDVATWVHWLQRHVAAGNATLLCGEFPAKLPGVPRTRFGTVNVDDSEATIKRLVAIVYSLLPADKRREVESLMG